MASSNDQLGSYDKVKQDEEAAVDGIIMVNATPVVDGVAAQPESPTAVVSKIQVKAKVCR